MILPAMKVSIKMKILVFQELTILFRIANNTFRLRSMSIM